MSLSFQKLNTVLVQDPRVIDRVPDYAVLKSGSQFTSKAWTSTSINTSSIQFSCPPPSSNVFVSRNVKFYLPMRLTYTGTPANGNKLIVPAKDAPRCLPLSSIIDTLSATINNQSVNINLADVIHCLSRFNSDIKLKNGDWSLTPNYPDQSQQYSDLEGEVRNPLSGYDNGTEETVMQRGAFKFFVVQNPTGNGTDPVTAIIDLAMTEPLYLPPFCFGDRESTAFYNVTSMDFNITFINNIAYRVWSHMTGAAGTVAFTSGSCVFGGMVNGPTSQFFAGNAPLMLINYITPQETQILSPNHPMTYPYFDTQRYPTQLNPLAAGQSVVGYSNNIQLSSIPRRLYIYIRESNQILYNDASIADAYCPISNISIQWMNKNGLLSSASPQELYKMSVKNHLNMSWTQWSGQGMKSDLTPVATSGGPICVEFATDIGLDSLDAPGKLGQYMLQVQVSFTNISARTMYPVLYLVPILEGTFTIPQAGRALINIGVITSQDILDAQAKPGINYHDVENVQGGNFFSGIKDFFVNKVLPAVKTFVGNKGISQTLGAIPHPIAQVGSTVAHAFGLGEVDGSGVLVGGRRRGAGVLAGEGVMAGEDDIVGGRYLSHAQLQKRLKKY